MATAASYFDRKATSTTRPGLSHLQPDPSSPHTPQRGFSSTFSSPTLSYYRQEDEPLIFEFGARHLNAGFAGESNPRCQLNFSPDSARRVGDYRQYYPECEDRPRKRKRQYDWGVDHELWRMDLSKVDLGLVEDKVERAVREAFTKYLLLDPKNKKLVLILPSLMPHRLLSSVLSTIFNNLQASSITLFPSPIASVLAAGCHAGLVVDIGWDETVVTAVYDFREVRSGRTTRSMNLVTQLMARLLKDYAEPEEKGPSNPTSEIKQEARDPKQAFDDSQYFEFAEEVTCRLAWCPVEERHTSLAAQKPKSDSTTEQMKIAEDDPPPAATKFPDTLAIPSPLPPRKTLHISFSRLSEPVESGLFAQASHANELDDHEQTLPQLIFKTLLSLPPDVRSVCMARIIITGGGSNISGLKTRILNEVSSIIGKRGWDPVQGKAAEESRQRLKEISTNRPQVDVPSDGKKASQQPQTMDEITEKLERAKTKGVVPPVTGEVRGVETLGAWAGGSLLVGLKVKGVVEVDRDSFLANGLAGAKKESEIVAATQRMSLGARSRLEEKPGWT
ncbi:MAG: hypothetical protein Q9222_007746, partial [Ikaeria aurantiellina]